jgi:DNA-directed RNA polymerase subunit RPC12/RpoP
MSRVEHFESIRHLGTVANSNKRRADYYNNPNYCKNCGKVIEIKEGQKPSEVRVKKFCNTSCAASYNNTGINRHARHELAPDKSNSAKVGATKAAANRRWRALRDYYQDPHYCNYCGYLIEVRVDEQVSDTKKRRFCNQTCKELHHASGIMRRGPDETVHTAKKVVSKRKKFSTSVKTPYGKCERCGSRVFYRSHTTKLGFYKSRQYCDECLKVIRSEASKKGNGKNALPKPIVEYTKGELLDLKGYTRYKNLLIKHANKTFDESGRERVCVKCGYSLVDICHIKDVSDFSEDSLIKEINDIANLVALCPTHHREFDKKLFNL